MSMQHDRDTGESPEFVPDVSIVLPVFNEIGHLDEELSRIRAAMDASDYTYEVVVVDDCSTDGSREHLQTIPWIRFVSFSVNRGAGAARRTGTEVARGDVVVWTDVDMTYPNDDIPSLVKGLEGYDQIVGARTSEEGTHKLARVPAKWSIRKLAEFLTKSEIPDLNTGYRAFRRSVAQQFLHLLPDGMSHVTTITMAFLANGYAVRYVDIPYATRAGTSKFRFIRDTRLYISQVTRMVMMWNPQRVLMPIALFLFVVGFGKVIFDVFDKNFRIGTNTLLVIGGGGLILVLALIADLVVQLNRPQHQVMSASVIERSSPHDL